MWDLNNQTPFAAERAWVRDKNGAEVWLIAVKGTFSIGSDGLLTIVEEQEPVCLAPAFKGAPETSGLHAESDLQHYKNNTDILVDGHAHAPNGQPVRQMDVALRVGPVHKMLRIFGDRIWQDTVVGPDISRPLPFSKMPITYERSFGGTDQVSENPDHHGWEPRNPIGQGFATRSEHLIGKPVPNIEDPKSLIRHWKDRPGPAGLGPIAGHWSPRVELAGTYDKHWEQHRMPLLPDDFDGRYYQCAPEDQQVPGYLEGGERVELYNMTPGGRLVFYLPQVTLGFSTRFRGSPQAEHRGDLHTVSINADEQKISMVWHTHLECHHRVLKLTCTTIRIKQTMFQSKKSKQRNSWEFA